MFATNWCVWVRTLVHETYESFLHHSELSHGSVSDSHGSLNDSSHSIYTTIIDSHIPNITTPYPDTYDTSQSAHDSQNSCPLFVDELLLKASPYLFPCVLEYSLLAAATMYSMYADIDFMNSDKDSHNSNSNAVLFNNQLIASTMSNV